MPAVKSEKPVEINNLWLILYNSQKVFAPISKNANSSIKTALMQGQEKTAFTAKDFIPPGYEVVAISRNPFDRLVSCWHWFHDQQPWVVNWYEFPRIETFEKFIDDVADLPDELANKHFRSQYNLLSHDGEFLPSAVLKYENLGDLPNFLPIQGMKRHKKSKRKPYTSYYSDRMIKRVEKRFEKDLDFFEYSFRS